MGGSWHPKGITETNPTITEGPRAGGMPVRVNHRGRRCPPWAPVLPGAGSPWHLGLGGWGQSTLEQTGKGWGILHWSNSA